LVKQNKQVDKMIDNVMDKELINGTMDQMDDEKGATAKKWRW
jgi:hypothetical protein